MTTIDPNHAAADSTIGRLLAADVDWLTSTDHKKIGRLFIGASLLAMLGTIVVNILVSIERLDGAAAGFDVDSWAQLMTSQRVGLVFGTALPLTAGLAVAVVPLQLGARALAFPRLVAAGMYLWLGGFILSAVSLLGNGGIGGGSADMVDLFLAAHGLMALGFTAVGASLVTSVLTTRAPGMTMRRVPYFSFSALVYGIGLVIVMPVLFGTLIYLFVDHRSGDRTGFGGNEGIASWAGWVFTQPATFLFAIPALGVFAELLGPTFKKRTPARGAVFAAFGLVGVSALAATTQQLRFAVPWRGSLLYIADGADFTSKLGDVLPWALFHLLPVLGATILFLMLAFVARPEKNDDGDTVKPNVTAGFLFAFCGWGMVLVGMAGAALEPILDLGLTGTVFGEAALVYIAYGAALGVMGGILHWAPKLWGRELALKAAAPLALLGVGATVLASFPHYIAGFLGQSGGLSYDDGDFLTVLNAVVLIGHGLMALTVLAFVGLLASTVFGDGDDAVDDPYDGHTIEWATTSPAPAGNFVDVPTVTSAEPLLDLKTASTSGSTN